MPRPQSDLTKYILSLSSALGPKDVVAKAKEKGFTTTEKNVHRVRSAKKKAAGQPTVAKKKLVVGAKKGAAKSASAGGGKSVNKSAFVRGLAATIPAKDVVAKAKAAGITLSEKYVYNVRASHRANGNAGAKRAPAKARAATSQSVKHGAGNGVEHGFVSASLELGLTRATELLALLRDKVRSLSV